MMKRACKTVALMAMAVLLTVSMMMTVSADDNSYQLLGGRFEQGIGNVTCENNVDVDSFPELYAAVAAAINDWDWHLGLLNEQYGVNWNMSIVENAQDPSVELVTMSNAESWAFLLTYFNVLAAEEYVDAVAYVMHFNNGNWVDPSVQNWDSCKIVFVWENIDAAGKLNDYYYLKRLANHEIGHTLGLGEYIYDNGVIMYPDGNTTTAFVPTAADLNGVYAIYG